MIGIALILIAVPFIFSCSVTLRQVCGAKTRSGANATWRSNNSRVRYNLSIYACVNLLSVVVHAYTAAYFIVPGAGPAPLHDPNRLPSALHYGAVAAVFVGTSILWACLSFCSMRPLSRLMKRHAKCADMNYDRALPHVMVVDAWRHRHPYVDDFTRLWVLVTGDPEMYKMPASRLLQYGCGCPAKPQHETSVGWRYWTSKSLCDPVLEAISWHAFVWAAVHTLYSALVAGLAYWFDSHVHGRAGLVEAGQVLLAAGKLLCCLWSFLSWDLRKRLRTSTSIVFPCCSMRLLKSESGTLCLLKAEVSHGHLGLGHLGLGAVSVVSASSPRELGRTKPPDSTWQASTLDFPNPNSTKQVNDSFSSASYTMSTALTIRGSHEASRSAGDTSGSLSYPGSSHTVQVPLSGGRSVTLGANEASNIGSSTASRPLLSEYQDEITELENQGWESFYVRGCGSRDDV